ncbi:GR25 family glycosyltransferase involved in LPS biosynthesis [Neorhizobium galegae]|uniref:glycosyltransferase family 25 protein n=1 Tax=Neorhizobium galegae TaxID=399 RepID=UPI001AE3F791|nr:glycosyltransferase family 25 protein [Neorhizobium galegae]MBP2550316.1 GR25 family glycosyltransferase involved in LPS biosynthesis [Neorhizobium galegae]
MKSVPGGRPLGLFAINLDRSPDRWRQMEQGFGALPWPLHRVVGVDARKEPEAVLAVRGSTLEFPPDAVGWNAHRNRLFMLTEEACLAGHVMAWRQFLASDFDLALVLEDDAEPQPGFAHVVEDLLALGFDADIVKLEGIFRPGGRKALPVAALGAHRLVRSLRPCSGAAAYIVTRRAAERLLARIGKACIPADDFLWAPSWHGLRIVDLSPWPVMQSGAESVIATAKAQKRARRRAPFGRGLAVALRRARERFSLLWAAADGRPHALLNATVAQWAPDVYNLGNRTAADAEDRRSSNG